MCVLLKKPSMKSFPSHPSALTYSSAPRPALLTEWGSLPQERTTDPQAGWINSTCKTNLKFNMWGCIIIKHRSSDNKPFIKEAKAILSIIFCVMLVTGVYATTRSESLNWSTRPRTWGGRSGKWFVLKNPENMHKTSPRSNAIVHSSSTQKENEPSYNTVQNSEEHSDTFEDRKYWHREWLHCTLQFFPFPITIYLLMKTPFQKYGGLI